MLIANELGQVLHSSTANMTGGVPRSPLDRQAHENLREPGSAATVHTLTGPSFRAYDRSGTLKHEGTKVNTLTAS